MSPSTQKSNPQAEAPDCPSSSSAAAAAAAQHVATYYSISVNAFPYEALQYLESSVLCFQSVKDVDFDHVVLQHPCTAELFSGWLYLCFHNVVVCVVICISIWVRS